VEFEPALVDRVLDAGAERIASLSACRAGAFSLIWFKPEPLSCPQLSFNSPTMTQSPEI
jgi:hypothetical protein